jgi:hypothetical protein
LIGRWVNWRETLFGQHRVGASIARCFLIQHTKTGKIILNNLEIYQVATKYSDIFNCKTFLNLPKLGFLVWLYAIWQPWRALALSKPGRYGSISQTVYKCRFRSSFYVETLSIISAVSISVKSRVTRLGDWLLWAVFF